MREITGTDRNPIEQLADDFIARHRRGEEPTIAGYIAQYPQWTQEILELFPAILLMEQVGQKRTDAAGTAEAAAPPHRLGDYRILREVGRGGMGIVYEAEQESLGRHVAVKVLLNRSFTDSRQVSRFQSEARAAARLHHSNIVPVYGVGLADGVHYYVMQFIQGTSLEQVLAILRRLQDGTGQDDGAEQQDSASRIAQRLFSSSDNTTTSSFGSQSAIEVIPKKRAAPYWANVARIGIQVAEALDYAHTQGTLHRDIKPSNLLLDLHGAVWITDFGLAKAADSEDHTRAGDLVGTLRYMGPERFDGRCDARSDVYSLGLTLYELCTRRRAFDDSHHAQLIARIRTEPPILPRKIVPEMPRDLETIILKAIAPCPDRRYPTARALAEDLNRFLQHRPIRARRVSIAERVVRSCRRNPLVASLLAMLALVILGAMAGVAAAWRDAEFRAVAEGLARDRAEIAQRQSRLNLEISEDNLYWSHVNQAQLQWRLNNVNAVRQVLDRCIPRRGDPDRRGWEWHYLDAITNAQLREIRQAHAQVANQVAFAPDGRWLISAGGDPYGTLPSGEVKLWDTTSWREIGRLDHPDSVVSLSVSGDGRRIASATWHRAARVWDAETHELLGTFEAHAVALNHDGTRLAYARFDAIVIQNLENGEQQTLHGHTDRVWSLAWSPSGDRLASSGDEAVKIWDAATGQILHQFGGVSRNVAVSPDGQLVAAAGRTARVWQIETGRLLHAIPGHSGDVLGVAFSPDARYLATAGADTTVQVYDLFSATPIRLYRGHVGRVGCVAFHPHGRVLASGSHQPAELKLWDLTQPPEYASVPNPLDAQALAFDREGQRILLAYSGGLLQQRELHSGLLAQHHSLDITDEWMTPATVVSFSGDRQRVAAIASDRTQVKLFDVGSGDELLTLRGHSLNVSRVALNHNGERIVSSAIQPSATTPLREVIVWNGNTGKLLARYHPAPRHNYARLHGVVAISPDGNYVAFDDYASADRAEPSSNSVRTSVRLIAISTEQTVTAVRDIPAVVGLAFSDSGQFLAVACANGPLVIWNQKQRTVRNLVPRHGLDGVVQMAFSPDDRYLAMINREQVRLWHVGSGQEVMTLRGAPPRPGDGGFNPQITWSPDGTLLAASNWDHTVSIWRAGDFANDDLRAQLANNRAFEWHLREALASMGNDFALQFHLKLLGNAEPPDTRLRLLRGDLFARLKNWDQAAADYALVVERHPVQEPEIVHQYAMLQLEARGANQDSSFWTGVSRGVAKARHWAFRTGVFAPQTVENPAQLADWALTALQQRPRDGRYIDLVGLAYYRAGAYEQAIRQCTQFPHPLGTPECVVDWLVLAMSHHRLGDTAQASEWFRKCEDALSIADYKHWSYTGWLEARALSREARATLAPREALPE